jgi:3-oxoadipate enol-lactonase
MSFVKTGGARIHYQEEGRADAPALLLCGSLGTDLRLWDPQMEAWCAGFRVIRHDWRGHGSSDAPQGPYTLDHLGADAISILDACGIDRAHVCGESLGGIVALWLAARHPDRIGRAVFANTAARIGTAELWQARADAVLTGGMQAVTDIVMERFFSAEFRRWRPEVVRHVGEELEAMAPVGYAGCCLALRDGDLGDSVAEIRAPSLLIAGSADGAATVADAEWLQSRIEGSRLLVLDAGHLSNLERPEEFGAAVAAFLTGGRVGEERRET